MAGKAWEKVHGDVLRGIFNWMGRRFEAEFHRPMDKGWTYERLVRWQFKVSLSPRAVVFRMHFSWWIVGQIPIVKHLKDSPQDAALYVLHHAAVLMMHHEDIIQEDWVSAAIRKTYTERAILTD